MAVHAARGHPSASRRSLGSLPTPLVTMKRAAPPSSSVIAHPTQGGLVQFSLAFGRWLADPVPPRAAPGGPTANPEAPPKSQASSYYGGGNTQKPYSHIANNDCGRIHPVTVDGRRQGERAPNLSQALSQENLQATATDLGNKTRGATARDRVGYPPLLSPICSAL